MHGDGESDQRTVASLHGLSALALLNGGFHGLPQVNSTGLLTRQSDEPSRIAHQPWHVIVAAGGCRRAPLDHVRIRRPNCMDNRPSRSRMLTASPEQTFVTYRPCGHGDSASFRRSLQTSRASR